ncbi:MAG: F0F1 ATP synthase subunit epsilon [Gammaproteobacteria bacterium]|nr:F0F1 ATP synthase subunit epsilon [Pseudomonadales bacterium]MCP5348054.1 F0F1 ATP synthase subunit epsilon [Pseudomonadales bacterium]
MKAFALHLQDATRIVEHPQVRSFVGEDRSGSFGILADHGRLVTVLVTGLARFQDMEGNWQYLAMPGAVLYFRDNVLTLSTRHFLLDSDYLRISKALQQELMAEEEKLHAVRESMRRMEEEVLKRLWSLGREAPGP